jgi:4-hydroxymandelate oxidase
MKERDQRAGRRRFLKFLAASPVVTGLGDAFAQGLPDLYAPERIARAADAINVFDFHEVAKEILNPGHYTYMAMGTDDGDTLRANRDGFRQFRLRVRRLVDVSNVDMSVGLFGRRYPVPILIAPCGTHKAFHPDGEPAVARAAKSRDVQMILSSVASTSIEDVNAVARPPAWFQLYTSSSFDVNLARAKRAEASGSPVLVLTVDLPDSNREAVARFRRDDNPECQACHAPGTGIIPPYPMIGSDGIRVDHLDWDFVDRLKRSVSMKLVIKGIVTREDAALAVEHGVDGIIVSNHGGRSEDSGRSTIECLPEVVDAIDSRIPVICDSGFRRGTDIFKALAIGADAIAIGRPYLWGLSAFGQEGVETVIDILSRELEIVMRQAGVTNIGQIGRQYLV